jgi:hypothetical protein
MQLLKKLTRDLEVGLLGLVFPKSREKCTAKALLRVKRNDDFVTLQKHENNF